MSFFVAGGTVPPGSPSYVERAADGELFEALFNGEYCYVLNSRQMGKSSLAVRIVTRLTEAGVRTAFVDLTRIGGATVSSDQWYSGLLLEAGRALSLRSEAAAWIKEHRDVGGAQRLLSFLHEVALTRNEGPIVLMIDEVDAVRSLGFSTDELFAGIRQLHNGRASDPSLKRLTVCLLGAALPMDLIRDPRTTPFNVGKRIELRDLSAEEAKPFAQALGGQGQLDRLMYWTGGHPFLTQALGAEIATGKRDIDALVRERYLDARAKETDTNLSDVGRRLMGDGDPNVGEKERADTLSLYAKLLRQGILDDESNPAAARIKMSGVARLENGKLVIRNRIYEHVFDAKWIRDNMPGQELRRQKKAFWRGALRVGSISAVVLAVVTTLAILAWTSRNEARQAQRATERNLYELQIGQGSSELIEGRLPSVERILDATAASPYRNIEWRIIKGQTNLGVARLPPGSIGYGIRFSPNCQSLWVNESILGSYAGAIQEYEVGTWKKARRVVSPMPVLRVSVSPDSRLLAAGGSDGRIAVWKNGKSQPFKLLAGVSNRKGTFIGEKAVISDIDFSKESGSLAAISSYESDGGATLLAYDRQLEIKQRISLPFSGFVLRYSPDGRRLALIYGRVGGQLYLEMRDSATLDVLWKGACQTGDTASLAWSPDSKILATGSSDGTCKTWDGRSGRLLRIFQPRLEPRPFVNEWHPGSGYASMAQSRIIPVRYLSPTGLAFTADGRQLAMTNGPGEVILWNVDSGRLDRKMSLIDGSPFTPEISPDGRWLAVSGQNSSDLAVLDLRRPSPIREIMGAQRMITPPAFSPDGRRLAIGDWMGHVRIYRLDTLQVEQTYRTENPVIECIGWPKDDEIVAWTGTKRRETISLPSGRTTVRAIPTRQEQWTDQAATNQGIYTFDDGHGLGVARLDADGKPVESLKIRGAIQASELSLDGRIAVTCTDRIVVLQTPGLRQVAEYPLASASSVGWSPDGKLLVAGCRNVLYLYDQHGLVRRMFGHQDLPVFAKFSHDGARIFTASADETVRIWSVATGQCLCVLPQLGSPLDVQVSPDGRWLLVTCTDLKVRLYPLQA